MTTICAHSVIHQARLGLLATLAHAVAADARAPTPAAPPAAVVSYAAGPGFSVIRGDDLFMSTRNATVLEGDILQSGPESFLVVHTQEGINIGIAPATSVFFSEDKGLPVLLVLNGWVKVDCRPQNPAAAPERLKIAGTHLAAECESGVVVLSAGPTRDEVFNEQGGAEIIPYGPAPHVEPRMLPQELASSDSLMNLVVKPRPSQEFLSGVPAVFRDELPAAQLTAAAAPSAPDTKKATPQWLRKVSFQDIERWLDTPVNWRGPFVTRFRARLKDTGFVAAMDAELSAYSSHVPLRAEWQTVLHPPPSRPEELSTQRPQLELDASDGLPPAADARERGGEELPVAPVHLDPLVLLPLDGLSGGQFPPAAAAPAAGAKPLDRAQEQAPTAALPTPPRPQ